MPRNNEEGVLFSGEFKVDNSLDPEGSLPSTTPFTGKLAMAIYKY
jgi:hypothetical protein